MVAFIDTNQHIDVIMRMLDEMAADTDTKERLGLAVSASDLSRREWEQVQEALQ